MKIRLFFLALITLSAFIFPSIIEDKISLTSKVIDDEDKTYSFTKAICNASNFCEDHIIECNNKSIIRMTPTGNTIQQSKNWIDPRSNELINKGCD